MVLARACCSVNIAVCTSIQNSFRCQDPNNYFHNETCPFSFYSWSLDFLIFCDLFEYAFLFFGQYKSSDITSAAICPSEGSFWRDIGGATLYIGMEIMSVVSPCSMFRIHKSQSFDLAWLQRMLYLQCSHSLKLATLREILCQENRAATILTRLGKIWNCIRKIYSWNSEGRHENLKFYMILNFSTWILFQIPIYCQIKK